MKKIASAILWLVMVLGFSTAVFAQAPTSIWEAQELARQAFDRPEVRDISAHSSPGVKMMGAGPTIPSTPNTYIVLRSNVGEFANATPSIEIRVDVVNALNQPVRIYGQLIKWAGNEYRTQGYFVPEGSVYGEYQNLPMFATYPLYRTTIPEAQFGDVYIVNATVVDNNGNQIQFATTRFMIGGDAFNHRNFYHLDGATYQGGFVYLRGTFPQGMPAFVRLGDPRWNSSGIMNGSIVTPNLITVSFSPGMMTSYAFPYDVVLHLPSMGESYTLPAGLKIEPMK